MPKDKFLTKLTNRIAKAMERTGNTAYDRYFIYIQIWCHFCTLNKPKTQYLQKYLFLPFFSSGFFIAIFLFPIQSVILIISVIMYSVS